MYKPCVVIPVYNHDKTMAKTLAQLQRLQLPVVIVNDASSASCSEALRALAKQYGSILVEHSENKGKGGAVKTGLAAALEAGFSHGVQVDADGQHNLADIGAFLMHSREHPEAIVIGSPVYDESVPKHREYARYLTHVWVWINTLSLSIKDSMCGFRVYPLMRTMALIEQQYIGDRMDFDIEILVKSYWQNTQIISCPTKVLYPADGVSHFQPFKDNVLISLMHTRLFFGMLKRLPALLARKIQGQGNG